MDELLLALGEAEETSDLAGVARHRRRVTRGHRVTHRKRLHDGVDEADLQRGQLLGALLELLAAVIRLHASLEQVLEDEEDDSGEADGADAESLVAERDATGEQTRRELGGQHGQVDGADAL